MACFCCHPGFSQSSFRFTTTIRIKSQILLNPSIFFTTSHGSDWGRMQWVNISGGYLKLQWSNFLPPQGMIAGYILQRFKKPPKISILMNVVLWVCSTSTLFAIIFGVVDGKLNQAFTSFYVSFGHTGMQYKGIIFYLPTLNILAAWGASLIWLTLSCCWKSCCWAKQIESFLSFKGFIPLSRLSYCAYLIHPTVMMITSFQCDGPIHLKHGMIVSEI